MRNTVRLILALFLIVLILSNYNSIRVLRHSIQFLESDLQERASRVLTEVTSEMSGHSWEGASDPQPFLQATLERYGLLGILLYHDPKAPWTVFAEGVASQYRDPAPLLENEQALRRDRYLILRGFYNEGETRKTMVLYLDARRVFQIERTTKFVSYTNLMLMAFAAILVIYFFESAFRPYNALVQAARSATPAGLSTESRNDADFLINTFNGVISNLKAKEQELAKLHRSEKARADDVHQLNQDLVRSISSGLILIDHQGIIRVFNESAGSLLELPQAAAVNRRYDEMLTGPAVPLREDIGSCFLHRTPVSRAEIELAHEPGRPRFVNASIMPIQDRAGSFAGVMCLFNDITDFKRLQQHMSQKEMYANLGEMAGGVAHEFRNSLATVAGYVQLLESRMTPEQNSYILPIHNELQSLQKVISDFLSFARPVQPEMQAVSLRELVEECAEEIRVSAPAGLDLTLRGEFPVLDGDEAMLRQVFLNLIRNAVQSVEGVDRDGEVVISGILQTDASSVAVEIQDNGSGIREEDLPKIFTPFFTTKRDGVGLGLAIVQKLVLQHNGVITVRSSTKGSLFRVLLPLAAG